MAGKSTADGLALPRVITNEQLDFGQTHSESKRGSPRS